MAKKYSLNANTESIRYLCSKDKRLAKVIALVGPIAYDLYEDAYSFLIHEIIEQMLSIKAGQKIYSRLECLCGGRINPSTVSALSDDEIRSTGTSNAKVTYIRSITTAVTSGDLNFETLSHLSDKEVIKNLTRLHGIGTWTAKMYLIFVLNRPNILPFEDGAFLQSYRWIYKTDNCSRKYVIKKCKKWSPYSSIAARYMYRALDMGLTREEFHLFK